MSEPVKSDVLTREEAVSGNVSCICLVLDEDVIKGLRRLNEVLDFPIGRLLSEVLRPFVNTFSPVADLKEQGKLTPDVLPEIVKGIESMVLRAAIAESRFYKEVKELEKQSKRKGG